MVLDRIEPTPARTREAKRLATRLIRDLKRKAALRGLKVQPKLVGSLAKDTHLSDPLDVDVFILFPRVTPRNVLEKQGVALGKSVLRRPVLKYAEHPYVHGRVGDLDVDIVPAYKLRDASGKLSAVDRTPFHTDYVRRHVTQRQRREIRLLKRWLRGVGAYGAETAVGGVSGYLAELLVLRYGAFDAVVKAMASWRPPVELALEGRATPLTGPLVFIDPVDASRNAAAAVTVETFGRLQAAALEYRKRPRIEFFFPGPRAAQPRQRLERRLVKQPTIGVEVPIPKGRPETVRPQGQRLAAKFARALEQEGFRVRRSGVFEVGKRLLVLLEHDPPLLPESYEHRGPRAKDEGNVERFLDKWKGRRDVARAPRVEGGRWVVTMRREKRSPEDFLGPQLGHLLQGFEFGRGARARTLAGADLLADADRHVALTVFLRRLQPWQS